MFHIYFKETYDVRLKIEKAMVELNEKQKKAVHHIDGPLLVLAGAGSGKTRVVTHRIAHLIDIGIPPSEILAVTFTNKAAEEMRSRIKSINNTFVLASTFHSLGVRILRESIHALGFKNDFTIYDEEDSEKLLRECINQLQIQEDKSFLKKAKHYISSAKNDMIASDDAEPEFTEIYSLYSQRLKMCNALDFDDLLYLSVKLLKEHEDIRSIYQNRWRYVLIDEYQDTNLAQYNLARLLVEKHQNIFAVGDPDQSIYSWRGARYQNILNFENDFPGAVVITLDQNYRSTNTILQASNALIEHNTDRYEKNLWSALGEGEKIGVFVAQNEKQEAEFVANKIFQNSTTPLHEIAIFYRTNAQSRVFEDALLAKRIQYQIIGGLSFYQRKEVKDILNFLKMIVSDADLIAFLRTINIPKRGLGAATLEKIVESAQEKNTPIFIYCQRLIDNLESLKLNQKQLLGLKSYVQTILTLRSKRSSLSLHELIDEVIQSTNYLTHLQEDPESYQERKENVDELIGKAAEWQDEKETCDLVQFLEDLSLRTTKDHDENVPTIKLMTIHNSKGLEFKLVFLVGLEEDLFPHINSKDNDTLIEEERRLCYVGMTRAKRQLYLCSTLYRYMWGVARFMRPSRFLKEIPAKYLQNLSATTLRVQETIRSHQTEYENQESNNDFHPGSKVRHMEFGKGTILKAYQGSFGLTYDVEFDSGSTRTLVAKYAKLSSV